MADTLVDTNVILDVAGPPSSWQPWSEDALQRAGDEGELVINQIVYSELVAGYASMEDLDEAVAAGRFRREGVPFEAAYLAGEAFLLYRRRGGGRTMPLPDFFIGAHAAIRGYRLLTRDRGYYRSYFPSLAVVSPETHP
jgi:predicted nucleic acid-binding protein